MPAAVFAAKAFAQYSFFIYAQLLHHALGGGVFGAALGFDAVKAHFADQILDGGAGGLRGVSFALKGRADLPVHFTSAAACAEVVYKEFANHFAAVRFFNRPIIGARVGVGLVCGG